MAYQVIEALTAIIKEQADIIQNQAAALAQLGAITPEVEYDTDTESYHYRRKRDEL